MDVWAILLEDKYLDIQIAFTARYRLTIKSTASSHVTDDGGKGEKVQ